MRVREVMTREVEVIHPDAPLQEAAEKMRDLKVGPLLVCDGEKLVGVITDRDITTRSSAEGHNPWTDRVRDAMTQGVVYCFEDQEVAEAARLMKQKRVRRLAVLSRNRRLAGIVSLGDVAVQTGDSNLAGRALEGISQPSPSHV